MAARRPRPEDYRVMRHLWIAMVAWLFCATCHGGDVFSVRTKWVERGKNGPSVHFDLQSSTACQIGIAEAPWNAPIRFTFAIVHPSIADGLRRLPSGECPQASVVSVKKGDHLKGDLNLLPYFPTFREEHRRGDLIFFWHWVPGNWADKSRKLGTYGGWLLIPKDGAAR